MSHNGYWNLKFQHVNPWFSNIPSHLATFLWAGISYGRERKDNLFWDRQSEGWLGRLGGSRRKIVNASLFHHTGIKNCSTSFHGPSNPRTYWAKVRASVWRPEGSTRPRTKDPRSSISKTETRPIRMGLRFTFTIAHVARRRVPSLHFDSMFYLFRFLMKIEDDDSIKLNFDQFSGLTNWC